MKIYYQDKDLILSSRLTNGEVGRRVGLSLIQEFGMKETQEAQEIWCYCPVTRTFAHWKNRGEEFLKNMLSEKGIHIKVTSANINNIWDVRYGFYTKKDLFLFNLQFGA